MINKCLVTTKFSIATRFCVTLIPTILLIYIHSGSLASHVYIMVIIPALLANPIITIPQLYTYVATYVCYIEAN